MADYEAVQRGPLRLKGSGAGLGAGKRKKKKAKDKAQILEQIVSSKKQEEEKKRGLDKRTPAQVAYEKMQEKRVKTALNPVVGALRGGPWGAVGAGGNQALLCPQQMERILKKASKTHKQRVEDFNRHLDTLTEHYDIPKVSWTK
ncbi:hypothetical protein AAES_66460 [Amazona aestiva]|uniref:Protein FAM32A n=1 Tax=Amazona aestiva TaxID=12930 RepID=A0A0Q3PP25_AMAAE|nr:hypothetical protein AAES_66460 [Amazona aestiva]